MVWIWPSLPDPGLKCLDLVVYEKARRNLASAGDDLEGVLIRNTCERGDGNGAHDWRTMGASDAVYRYAVSLHGVMMNGAKGICECLVSMRNMAEVALDPVGSRRYVKAKTFGVSNLGGLVGVA